VSKCRQIYEEHASGKNTARPQLEACLKSLRESDTLIVWRLDRLGRSLGDLIRLTQKLQTRGIAFASLTERIDTRSPTGANYASATGKDRKTSLELSV
jgi:DNA invertase Pin-like site-specific DNA recombinase